MNIQDSLSSFAKFHGQFHIPLEDLFSLKFFSEMFYFLGSVLWFIAPFCYLWKYWLAPYLEIAASASFVLNGILDLVDYALLNQYYKICGGYPQIFGGGKERIVCGSISLQRVNWTIFIYFTFFLGALSDLVLSFIDTLTEIEVPPWVYACVDVFGSGVLWNLSAVSSICACYYDRYSREQFHSKIQFSMSLGSLSACYKGRPDGGEGRETLTQTESEVEGDRPGSRRETIEDDRVDSNSYATVAGLSGSLLLTENTLPGDPVLTEASPLTAFPAPVRSNSLTTPRGSGMRPLTPRKSTLARNRGLGRSRRPRAPAYLLIFYDFFLLSNYFFFAGNMLYMISAIYCYFYPNDIYCFLFQVIGASLFIFDYWLNLSDSIRETVYDYEYMLDEQESLSIIIQEGNIPITICTFDEDRCVSEFGIHPESGDDEPANLTE